MCYLALHFQSKNSRFLLFSAFNFLGFGVYMELNCQGIALEREREREREFSLRHLKKDE